MRPGVCLCVTLLLSTATVGSSSGLLRLNSGSSIVGGKDARPGKWPWMVFIRMTDGKNNISCGGSLINSQWVLTAAHCVNNRHVKSVVVGRLKLLQENTGWEYQVHSVITHPQYKGRPTLENDLALVQLNKSVDLKLSVAWPVPLPTPMDVLNSSSDCWVTGWGLVADNEKLKGNKTLQQLKLPLVNDTTCRQTYPYTTDKQLCAGYLEGGKGACKGDSGGPLVCKSYGRFVQVGVVSFAAPESCVLAGYPAVFTRVSRYAGFIDRVIHQYS